MSICDDWAEHVDLNQISLNSKPVGGEIYD